MRKVTTAILSLALAIPAWAGIYPGFDENRIVLSFGVISDVHIDSPDNAVAGKFVSALKQLDTAARTGDNDGLDGVLVAGDLVNNPYKDPRHYQQVDWFRDLYKSVFPDPAKIPMVYSHGNHDTFKEWTPEAIAEGKNICDRLGEEFFLTDLDIEARDRIGCRHCVIKGCHILCINPIGRGPVVYDPEAVKWLDNQLAQITTEAPDRYVLILTHAMIYNTVYGSLLGNYWYTSQLTPVLEKYPQAVTFGGHLHFPLNDPRSVWQGNFTAMGTGSVRYMAIEAGRYEYMDGATVMKDRNEFSQGLLLQFDADGNMRATRMDFYHNAGIDKPWVMNHPDRDRSHLKAYRHDTRRKANKAPRLEGFEVRIGEAVKEVEWPVYAEFPAGIDDEFVHHYVITLKIDGVTMAEKRILADFYLHPQTSQMKTLWKEPIGNYPKGNYEMSIVAVDSWGATSRPVIRKFTI